MPKRTNETCMSLNFQTERSLYCPEVVQNISFPGLFWSIFYLNSLKYNTNEDRLEEQFMCEPFSSLNAKRLP